MRLLLDTHIWLWQAQGSKHLGQRLRRELANPRNELWLSPVSVWECLTLNAKGKIRIDESLSTWVPRVTAPLREAPLTHEIVVAAYHLPTAHPDPADRFLAATAQILDLTLVTADANLLGLGTIQTLGNR